MVEVEGESGAAERVEDAARRRLFLPADVSARRIGEPLEHRAAPWGAARWRWGDTEVGCNERGGVPGAVPVGGRVGVGGSTHEATGAEQ